MATYELSQPWNYNSTATVTRILMTLPEGRVRRKVKEIEGIPSFPQEAHPRRKHRWHEVLDKRRADTGFVECRCGAMGIAYSRSRR